MDSWRYKIWHKMSQGKERNAYMTDEWINESLE